VTAFFRFEGTLAELGELRAGRVELINPLAVQTVQVAERTVPLETDLTTPLAYFLAGARLDGTGYEGFLYPDKLADRTGMFTLEPYQPGKIPVVFVHGLFSSPLTWAPVFNDLLADPELRKRFQFWAYFYPTGNPYLATAADLRQGLERLCKDLDPKGRDPALNEMVFVGHSMGGLVSKLVTVEGGDDFWGLVSSAPLNQLKLQPQTRGELQSVFYFEPLPSVRRVIFLGTPHHGSRLSPSVLGRVGARLAGLPRTLRDTLHDLDAENVGLPQLPHKIPNSVDLLDPSSPALELLAARPKPRGVHYHSVIGVTRPNNLLLERWLGGGLYQPTDGVVPYKSAHIEDAESELVVPADHYNVHHHPLAILEIRRILLEHLRETDSRLGGAGSGVVPVGARVESSRPASGRRGRRVSQSLDPPYTDPLRASKAARRRPVLRGRGELAAGGVVLVQFLQQPRRILQRVAQAAHADHQFRQGRERQALRDLHPAGQLARGQVPHLVPEVRRTHPLVGRLDLQHPVEAARPGNHSPIQLLGIVRAGDVYRPVHLVVAVEPL
jgi:pimeloyl-ACP methyl ester carboxylesterase